MYRLLVVDDEQRERDGIEFLIGKYGLPFHVDKAEHGRQALEMFSKEQYDIVMTDIKMPIMDGIELIQRLREESEVLIVIYSAYGEFEYARAAISNGVSNYILKPLVVEDFLTCFRDLIDKCEKKKVTEQAFETAVQMKEFQFSSDIFYLMNQKEETLAESKNKYGRCQEYLAGRKSTPLIIRSENESFIKYFENLFQDILDMAQGNAVNIMMNESTVLTLLFEITDSRKLTEKLIQKYENLNTHICIAVGRTVMTLEELKREYNKMNELLEGYFILNSSYVVSTESQYGINETANVPDLLIKTIKSSIESKNVSMAQSQIEQLLEYIEKNNHNSSVYVKYITSEIMKDILDTANKPRLFEYYLRRIYGAKNKEKIRSALVQALGEMKKESAESKKSGHHIIQAVEAIIADDYGNHSLGLVYLAEKVNLSSAYLSGLFKAETGKNIVQYITEYRLEKAKELLETTFYKVGEISEMVGYSNHSYFTLLFNNTYGKRPIDYREMKKE